MQLNAIADAEAAAIEDCEIRDSISSQNMKWKEFFVDPKILSKREKTISPPSSTGRSLRYSSNSNAGSLPKMPSVGSSGNLAGSASLRSSKSLTQLNPERSSSSAALSALASSNNAGAASTSFTMTPPKSSNKHRASINSEPNIIAHGTNSTVLLLAWQQPFDEEEPVAVKVYKRSSFFTDLQFEAARRELLRESESNHVLTRKAAKSDGFVRVYGVVTGALTRPIAKLLRVSETEECIGLVMRYESGGSLQHYLHSCFHINISVPERLQILALAARGLGESHMAGLVHNDVQSKNVIMSHRGYEGGYLPKWTGFGNSVSKSMDANDIMQAKRRRSRCDSTTTEGTLLSQDSHIFSLNVPSDGSYILGIPHLDPFATAVTPSTMVYSVYTAPELLSGLTGDYEDVGLSFNDGRQSPVSVPKIISLSWRTDMYAFALLCWETLTRTRPFDGEAMEGRLAVAVEDGERPSIDDLKEIQRNDHLVNSCNNQDGLRGEFLTSAVIMTIEKCWQADSNQRKSAIEMFATLNQAYSLSSTAKFDIYISYCVESSKNFCCYVYYWLTKLGYRVWMGVNDDRSEWDPMYFGSKPPTPTSMIPPPPSSPPSIGKGSPNSRSNKHSGSPTSTADKAKSSKSGGAGAASAHAHQKVCPPHDEQFCGKIANCDVVLAFVNSSYQSQACCLTELHKAKLCYPPKRIVAIVTEPHPFQWANRELEMLCELHGHMFIDLSHVSALPEWTSQDVIPTHIVTALKDSLVPLFTILHEIDCFPSNLNNLEYVPSEETMDKGNDVNKSCALM
jgi:serine/threonine protein kinase